MKIAVTGSIQLSPSDDKGGGDYAHVSVEGDLGQSAQLVITQLADAVKELRKLREEAKKED